MPRNHNDRAAIGRPHLTDGAYCEEHAKVMEQHYEVPAWLLSANATAEHGNESVTATFISTRFVSSA